MDSASESRQATHSFPIKCSQDTLIYRNTLGFGGVEEILAGFGELENVITNGGGEHLPVDVIVMRLWGNCISGGPELETSGPQNIQVIGVRLQSTCSSNTQRVRP